MASERILSKEEIETALNERHSPEKQKLLSAGQVTIAGLGGLGSNVAYSLARIGVGHLHLIDFDVVDITNLNRQQYFMEHIGMYKTDALKSLLLKINPYLDIRTDCVKVTEENLKGSDSLSSSIRFKFSCSFIIDNYFTLVNFQSEDFSIDFPRSPFDR